MPKKPQKKAEQSAFFCMPKREKHNGVGKCIVNLRIVKRRLKLQQPSEISQAERAAGHYADR